MNAETIRETIRKKAEATRRGRESFLDAVMAYEAELADNRATAEQHLAEVKAELQIIERTRADLIERLEDAETTGSDCSSIKQQLAIVGPIWTEKAEQAKSLEEYRARGSEEGARAVKDAFDQLITAEKDQTEAGYQIKREAAQIMAAAEQAGKRSAGSRAWLENIHQGNDEAADLVRIYENQFGAMGLEVTEDKLQAREKIQRVMAAKW